jgi:hypothetical protein
MMGLLATVMVNRDVYRFLTVKLLVGAVAVAAVALFLLWLLVAFRFRRLRSSVSPSAKLAGGFTLGVLFGFALEYLRMRSLIHHAMEQGDRVARELGPDVEEYEARGALVFASPKAKALGFRLWRLASGPHVIEFDDPYNGSGCYWRRLDSESWQYIPNVAYVSR